MLREISQAGITHLPARADVVKLSSVLEFACKVFAAESTSANTLRTSVSIARRFHAAFAGMLEVGKARRLRP